ncbi:MAG: FkbM family methyltransferase [Reyranellaceae bacterium]
MRLDALGRWLLTRAPVLAKVYAGCLTRRQPRLAAFPGWTFACEYFVERRWMALRRAALWEFALERGLVVPLIVPWYGGTSLEVTLGNDNSLCLYVAGTFEPNEFAFLDVALRPGMTFVDVGANEGLYTVFAAHRVGAAGRVLSVEPSSRERAVLKRNIELNRFENVTVVPHALAAEAGFASLQVAPKLHGGHNTLGGFAHEGIAAIGAEQVPVETFDAMAQRLSIDHVDVMKIDVEGAEVKVLRGARRMLMRCRPTLLIEANESALRGQGTSTTELVALLQSLGYEIRVFSYRTGEAELLTEGGTLSANIVAIASAEVAEASSARLASSA